MTYEKPEVAVLGEALSLSQGSGKSISNEPNSSSLLVVSDCELDD